MLPEIEQQLRKAVEVIQPRIDRLAENLVRAHHLVNIHNRLFGNDEIKENEIHKTDILRAAVVFIHAALEDFLRTLAATYLPLASEEALNLIPLAGLNYSGRPEKFFLGKLVKHRGKSIDEVIEESILKYLERSNYNNTEEIASLLSTINVDVSKVNETFPELDQLMQRRHLIVHRADRIDFTLSEKKYAATLTAEEVESWIDATQNFMVQVLTQASSPEIVQRFEELQKAENQVVSNQVVSNDDT